ncbi:uncharacterized protein [Anser cygnoides]|uniref:uncharacterized protein isoform X3 n=1 Tax=Anser cygnoides TaxID=8845 RepID=UPI0034D19AF0
MDCSVPRHAGSCSSVVRGRSFPEPGPGPRPGPGRARREAQVAAGCERGCRRAEAAPRRWDPRGVCRRAKVARQLKGGKLQLACCSRRFPRRKSSPSVPAVRALQQSSRVKGLELVAGPWQLCSLSRERRLIIVLLTCYLIREKKFSWQTRRTEGRKAAAGVLQSQVSQEKEQPVCPSCPAFRVVLEINRCLRGFPERWLWSVKTDVRGSCACVWLVPMAGVDDSSHAPKLLVLMLDLPLGKGLHPVCSAFLPYHLVYRRKALSREMEKELIIPLPHSVRPEDKSQCGGWQGEERLSPSTDPRSQKGGA